MTASKNLFKKYPNQIFVETGTHHGAGVQQALDEGFAVVYSIEIDQNLFVECFNRFRNKSNVNLTFGDSGSALKKIMDGIDKPVTFWLDAHVGESSAPLLKELDLIKNHPIKTHTILIDDLRCWDVNKIGFDTESLKKAILEINPNYTFSLEEGHVPNDVLAAYIK